MSGDPHDLPSGTPPDHAGAPTQPTEPTETLAPPAEAPEPTEPTEDLGPADEFVPPPDDTVKIDLGLPPAPPPPPPPKPKPVIIPERYAEGWKTNNLQLRAVGGHSGFYLNFVDQNGHAHTIHLTPAQLDGLVGLTESGPGLLWRKLSDIPLERPLPSRALEEELRVLLTTFGNELRRPRR